MRKLGGGGRGFSVEEARGSSLLDCAGGIEGGAVVLEIVEEVLQQSPLILY